MHPNVHCSIIYWRHDMQLFFFFFYSKNRRNKKNKNSVKQAVSKDAVKLHGICKSKSFNISKQSKSHISEPSYMLKFK